jgi:flagellar basal body-associated protein FliL
VSEETEVKSGFSAVALIMAALLSLVLGYGAGAFTGQPVLAALGMASGDIPAVEGEAQVATDGETNPLFSPMAGVFDPKKERFYAEVGELLIAMSHRGATRHLQLTVQLVGHDQDYMKTVENDVPAIRNGLLVFFNQQEFSKVSTYEGREALRRETLQRINEIIGATVEERVADVYFTDYITQ